jgi:hypothetical protein
MSESHFWYIFHKDVKNKTWALQRVYILASSNPGENVVSLHASLGCTVRFLEGWSKFSEIESGGIYIYWHQYCLLNRQKINCRIYSLWSRGVLRHPGKTFVKDTKNNFKIKSVKDKSNHTHFPPNGNSDSSEFEYNFFFCNSAEAYGHEYHDSPIDGNKTCVRTLFFPAHYILRDQAVSQGARCHLSAGRRTRDPTDSAARGLRSRTHGQKTVRPLFFQKYCSIYC